MDDGKQGAVASVPREPAVVFSTLGLDTLTLPWLVASRTNARQGVPLTDQLAKAAGLPQQTYRWRPGPGALRPRKGKAASRLHRSYWAEQGGEGEEDVPARAV